MSELAAKWICRYEIIEKYGDTHPEAETLFSAYDELGDLVIANPLSALHIIEEIYQNTDNAYVLENLGAGPVETLLVMHGASLEGAIDALLDRHPLFQVRVLQYVWWTDVALNLRDKYEKSA